MAVTYGDYYTLETTSYNGNHFKIVISKKNYAGTPKTGVLGATPQLVRDKNDRICGTSLEIPIQCNVDGELYEFYTSDISLYRVAMYENDSLVFSGSLLPELYSEPNVAPPFDVILTAVDGLGELKRAEYAGMNYASINMTIEQLLSYTGVELPVRYLSALRCDEAELQDSDIKKYAFGVVGLDIRHLDGESCYEVLQQLLEMLNVYICQYNGMWVIYSETYIHRVYMIGGEIPMQMHLPNGRPSGGIPSIAIGSVNKSPWWPIEHMNLSVVPARKAIKLKADDNYRESILEDYNFENGDPKAWSLGTFPRVKLNGRTVVETWGGHTMYQNVEFLHPIRERLKIRTMVSFSRELTASGPAQWHIAITAYDASGKNYEFWNEHGTAKDIIYWEHPGVEESRIQLSAPKSAEKVPYKWEKAIDLNTLPDGVVIKSMRIGISMQYAYQGYRYYVHECALYPDDNTVTKGYKLEGALNNGARDSISAASLIPLHDDEYRVWDGDAMYGVPYLYNQWSGSWKNRIKRLLKFSLQYAPDDEYYPDEPEVAYCEALVKDLARNYGLPRVRMQGVLNVPSSINNPDFIGMPLVFQEGKMHFTPEAIRWRVAEDEMDVDLISVPTAEVEVGEITRYVEY